MAEYDIFGYHVARVIEERGSFTDVFDAEQKLAERFLAEAQRLSRDSRPTLVQVREWLPDAILSVQAYRDQVVRVRALVAGRGDSYRRELAALFGLIPALRVNVRDLLLECARPGMRELIGVGFMSALDALTKRFRPAAGGGEADLSHPNYRLFRQYFTESELRALILS